MACLVLACTREPIAVTVCEVVERPESYQGKLLKVSASVMSDGLEHTVLIDQACPGRGLAPETSGELPEVPGIADLNDAIFDKHSQPGTGDKDLSAVFVGTFEWRPKQIPRWVLHVSQVSNVEWSLKEK
jgi:hypothetical protein